MRLAVFPVAIGLLAAGCASIPADEADRTLSAECGDIVAAGTLASTGEYADASIPGDLLGHGWFSATFTVRRTLQGQPLPRSVTVRYLSHVELRDGDYTIVLMQAEDGVYAARDLRAQRERPRVVSDCPDASQASAISRSSHR